MPRVTPAAAILALAALTLPVDAQQTDCADAISQVEMNLCAELGWQEADTELNDAYEEAMALMTQLDADYDPPERGAAMALRDAQRAWIGYRDNACAAEGWLMHGGSAEPLAIYGCLERITRVRAAELWDLVSAGG